MSSVPEFDDRTSGGVGVNAEPPRKRDSAALLVRVWREPGTHDGSGGVVRCYMKNLKTGEELYMGSADALASQLLSQLDTGRSSEGAPPESGAVRFSVDAGGASEDGQA